MTESDAIILARLGVRDNTILEDIHAGISPVSVKGDYSDVKVIDATGREIPWSEVSRITEDEMKTLMKGVVNNLYTLGQVLESVAGPIMTAYIPEEWDRSAFDKKFAEALIMLGSRIQKKC